MYRKVFVWALSGVMTLSSMVVTAQEMSSKVKQSKTTSVSAKPLTEDQKVAHLIERITFGARPGDLEHVKKIGWQKFLNEQLFPEKLDDSVTEQKLKTIHSLSLSSEELARTYDVPQQELAARLKEKGFDIADIAPGANAPNNLKTETGDTKATDQEARRREARRILAEMGFRQPRELVEQLQQSKIIRAVYSERQFQEVMTDFWFNHFNVYINKGADRILTPVYERDAIRAKAFSKFSELLKATAESPAMLFYLDNWTSATPNAKGGDDREERLQKMLAQMERGRRARKAAGQTTLDDAEFEKRRAQMQQNLDRLKAAKRNRGINENYAREIMELHTLGVDGGYTQKDVQEVARCFTGWTIRQPRQGGGFYFNPAIHDDGEKVVLGQKIPAGGGIQDGYKVIEILSKHPSTAKFISTKLARKFVSDNPPATLVDKMTQTFRKTDGDTREVLRTMFTAPEFWSSETYRAKIKTPFEMTVSAVRALSGDTNGNPQFHKWISQMGEGLFQAQPPTGYPDTADHWVNTGALLDRMNFALALSANRINGTRVDLAKLAPAMSNVSRTQLVDHFAKLLLRTELSPQTRATIDKSLSETQSSTTLAMNNTGTNSDAAKIVGLLLGSPEFQRQ